MKFVYEVVSAYTVEAQSKAAAERVAGIVAQTLTSTRVLRTSVGDGTAQFVKTTARFKRNA
jgi:hypothetical protein